MAITLEQIKAARALLVWHQADLAKHSGVSQVTIGNIESGKNFGSRKGLQAITATFENAGIEFFENGVRIATTAVTTLQGKNSFVELLNKAFFSFHGYSNEKKEILYFGADDSRSTSQVLAVEEKLRKIGVTIRCLAIKDTKFFSGPIEEYRELPQGYAPSEVTVIFQDKVGLLVEHKPYYQVLLIRNKFVADDYKRIFEYFWELGAKPPNFLSLRPK